MGKGRTSARTAGQRSVNEQKFLKLTKKLSFDNFL